MKAVCFKHTDCTKALIPASDLSITNDQGRTAFHVCILAANEECFDVLLPHVSDVDVRSVPGVEPSNNNEAVQFYNASPLHHACHVGQYRMVKALLKRGADRLARDSLQKTPLFHAVQFGHLSCVVLLVGQPGKFKMTPAEVDMTDVVGFTALHTAAEQGFEKICGVLLEAGARLDAKTPRGYTPRMIAQHFHPSNEALHALLSGGGPALPSGRVCDRCGKTAAQASVSSLKACSQCHAVRYCGAECSVAAWPGHKAACKARAAEREWATRLNIVSGPVPSGL
jgi:ankyrin repeat protein